MNEKLTCKQMLLILNSLFNRQESEKNMRLEKTYADFKALKKHLSSAKANTLTFYVDQLLLTSNTTQEILDKVNEIKKTKFKDSNDFKNLAIIKKHIRYRQMHNKICFSVNKKHQVRAISVDYKSDAQERLTY